MSEPIIEHQETSAAERTAAALKAFNARRLEELEEGLRWHEQAQEGRLLIDLDAAKLEDAKRNKPLRFTLAGKEYLVPSSMPADAGLFYYRECSVEREGNRYLVVQDATVFTGLLDAFLGDEFAKALRAIRMPQNVIHRFILKPIFIAWGLVDVLAAQGEEATEEEKKTGKTSESSPGDSEPSRPTSSGTTESISPEPSGGPSA